MVQSALLNKYSETEHFFLEKEDMLNSAKFTALQRMVCIPDQIHSDKVIYLKKFTEKKHQGDGLITDKKIYLGVYTADCLPILFFETRNKTIAAVHAGWRGLLNGIIFNTIEYMSRMGSDKKRIIVAVGPHIRKCCYEISAELADKFFTKYKYLHKKSGSKAKLKAGEHFSLTDVALSKLKYASIPSENIDSLNICTSCNTKFYSYRRDNNKSGRMLNTIGLI